MASSTVHQDRHYGSTVDVVKDNLAEMTSYGDVIVMIFPCKTEW